MSKSEVEITREQFLVIQSLLGAIRSADSCYCGTRKIDSMGVNELKEIASSVAHAASMNQIENCLEILGNIKLEKLKQARGE